MVVLSEEVIGGLAKVLYVHASWITSEKRLQNRRGGNRGERGE